MNIKDIKVGTKYRIVKPKNSHNWDISVDKWEGKIVTVSKILDEGTDELGVSVKETGLDFYSEELEPIVGDWDK